VGRRKGEQAVNYPGKVGAHPPHPPAMGASPPWTPVCPPPLAEGLPAFWVPLVGGFTGMDCSPLLRFCGGTPPTPPARGASPPGPPFAHPRWLRVCQRFGSHSWQGFQSGLLAPSFESPRHEASPPGPPLPTPVG
jgi:hypothetical protein